MKKITTVLTTLALAFALSAPTHAGIGITGHASTLGIGVQVTQSLVPMINVRGGVNWLDYGTDGTEGGIRYNIDLKLKSFTALVDLHPLPLLGFRLTGGIVFNSNGLDLLSDPITQSIDIGGTIYTTTGTLAGDVDFESTAPYLGIGWGNAASSRIGLAIDLGVAFQGSPQVDLTPSGPLASEPGVAASVQLEEQDLQDDINGFKYYPVISVGVSFKITP